MSVKTSTQTLCNFLIFSLGISKVFASNPFRVAQPTEILHLLNNFEYSKYATPTWEIDEPTEITIGLYVEGMSSLQAQSMDFHVDLYFEQRWSDRRLKHSAKYPVLIKDLEIFEKMWHPDLYFANANSALFFDVTAPNFLLWIFPNGTVHHDSRISLRVICNMHLGKYPLDTQECNLRILSYAYTESQLNISWRLIDPIIMNEALKLPDMHIVSFHSQRCDGTYALATWSCVLAVFKFEREIMHHVLQSYVPTVLIVVISWFSFWLDIDAVPGRVSLCITTLLTLATQASSARLSLPQVSYAKAIDVWMEACLGFVFGVLIEFTAVNFVSRTGRDLEDNSNCNDESAAAMLKDNTTGANSEIKVSFDAIRLLNNALDYSIRKRRMGRRMAIRIDKLCRLLFPLAFLIFNIIYWPYYMYT